MSARDRILTRVRRNSVPAPEHARVLHRLGEATAPLGWAPVRLGERSAAAFLAFAEVPADVVLLEVGLGGRLVHWHCR